MFYGGDTKFGYTACQWIEAQTIETRKKTHHKMCGHEGERNGDGLGFKWPRQKRTRIFFGRWI